jgi:hypothetical protein
VIPGLSSETGAAFVVGRSRRLWPEASAGAFCLISAILVLVGCSGPKPPRPTITREEFDEVQQHRLMSDPERDRSYFSSARGKELTTRMLKRIFGDRGVSILKEATRAEAFRVAETPGSEPRSALEEIDGYPITSAGSEQGEGFVRKLTTYLLDGRIYFTSPDCEIYGPGVVFRLWRGRESMTLNFRYKCQYLFVSVYDASGVRVHNSGTYYNGPFGDPDVIAGLIKKAFPDAK